MLRKPSTPMAWFWDVQSRWIPDSDWSGGRNSFSMKLQITVAYERACSTTLSFLRINGGRGGNLILFDLFTRCFAPLKTSYTFQSLIRPPRYKEHLFNRAPKMARLGVARFVTSHGRTHLRMTAPTARHRRLLLHRRTAGPAHRRSVAENTSAHVMARLIHRQRC